ncbi:MAG: helicase-related protein [Myxococcota bacterium]
MSDLYSLGLGSGSRLVALLGPTNTGKTHRAIQRMIALKGGMIGLPLRLLAREVYSRLCEATTEQSVALITGEERIIPLNPVFWVCTVESMPLQRLVPIVVIDEVQLATHPTRGHVFTDRLLNARGTKETWFLGSDSMRPLIEELLPTTEFQTANRHSTLSYVPPMSIRRLPARSAVVAFSMSHVYELAEQIRNVKGGVAIVLGALSPKVRNQQVALFESGRVQQLVATDAIGMGLNLDIRHVAFAGLSKFDGQQHRMLDASELAQIAGRAGRFTKDGTFGLIDSCADNGGLARSVIDAIEQHSFHPVRKIWYRNSQLDFSSVEALWSTLHKRPFKWCLMPIKDPDDELALEALLNEPDIEWAARTPSLLELLWDVCRIPNFSQLGAHAHHGLLKAIYRRLISDKGHLTKDWVSKKLFELEQRDGGIHFVMGQLERVRTWAYVAHRQDWVSDPQEMRRRCLALENRLSDRLHERLTLQFIDEDAGGVMLKAEPESVQMDGLTVQSATGALGHMSGFRFVADSKAERTFGVRQTRKAGHSALKSQAEALAQQFLQSADPALGWDDDLQLCWRDIPLGWIERGTTLNSPRLRMHALELLPSEARRLLHLRLEECIKGMHQKFRSRLMTKHSKLKGLMFALQDSLGVIKRSDIDFMLKGYKKSDWKWVSRAGIVVTSEWVMAKSIMGPQWQRYRAALIAAWISESKVPSLPGAKCAHGLDWSASFGPMMGFEHRGELWIRVDIAERVRKRLRSIRGPTPWDIPNEPMSWLGCGREDWNAVIRTYGYRIRSGKMYPPKRH